MNSQMYEKKLSRLFLKLKDYKYKKYYDYFAVLYRILEEIESISNILVYPEFEEESFKILKYRWNKKKRIKNFLKKINTYILTSKYRYFKSIKFSLYEKILMRKVNLEFKSNYHHIIINSLKIFYLLRKEIEEIENFEKDNRILIENALDFNNDLENTSRVLINKVSEYLDKIDLISTKEQIRIFVLFIQNLILFESEKKKIIISKLLKKYKYIRFLISVDYLRELNSKSSKKFITKFMKNYTETVFKRLEIKKRELLEAERVCVTRYLIEKEVTRQYGNSPIFKSRWVNNFCYRCDKLIYLTKENISILLLNEKKLD